MKHNLFIFLYLYCSFIAALIKRLMHNKTTLHNKTIVNCVILFLTLAIR